MNSYMISAMPFPKSERLYRALYDSPGQSEPRNAIVPLRWPGLLRRRNTRAPLDRPDGRFGPCEADEADVKKIEPAA